MLHRAGNKVESLKIKESNHKDVGGQIQGGKVK